MAEELKPCPFLECEGGLIAVEFDASGWTREPALQAWVECDCGARGPKTPTYVGARETIKDKCISEATRAWNTRTPSPEDAR